jgi:hypothetical protein
MAVTIILPVVLETDDFSESEVIVVECPECYAIVRKSRLDLHKAARHDD